MTPRRSATFLGVGPPDLVALVTAALCIGDHVEAAGRIAELLRRYPELRVSISGAAVQVADHWHRRILEEHQAGRLRRLVAVGLLRESRGLVRPPPTEKST